MATAAENLASAQVALHKIVTGTAPSVVVDRDGQRVEYHKSNLPALRQYIAELTATVNGTATRGPLRMWF